MPVPKRLADLILEVAAQQAAIIDLQDKIYASETALKSACSKNGDTRTVLFAEAAVAYKPGTSRVLKIGERFFVLDLSPGGGNVREVTLEQ